MHSAPAHRPLLALLIRLGAIAALSTMSALIKLASQHGIHLLEIMFWRQLVSVPMTAVALPFVMTAHDTTGWLLLLAIGISGVIGQLLLTAALRFGAVASVIVMDYSQLFWATLYGWLLFSSLPPASTWLGAPLIIAAGLVIAWREHRLSRPTLRDIARAEGT